MRTLAIFAVQVALCGLVLLASRWPGFLLLAAPALLLNAFYAR